MKIARRIATGPLTNTPLIYIFILSKYNDGNNRITVIIQIQKALIDHSNCLNTFIVHPPSLRSL